MSQITFADFQASRKIETDNQQLIRTTYLDGRVSLVLDLEICEWVMICGSDEDYSHPSLLKVEREAYLRYLTHCS